MKWIKRIALGVVSLALLLVALVYGVSEARLRKQYDVAGATLAVTDDPAQVERGRHLATAVSKCADCHGPDLGGKVFIEAGPMGTLIASNLTKGRGGVLPRYSNEQLEAAIRHGVNPENRGLLFMPSQEFQYLSDEDAAAIIAYIRSLPGVDRELPRSRVGPLGRALFVTGQLPLVPAELIDHRAAGPRTAPPAGPTREYGQYLANVGGCVGCHGPDLGGAPGHGPDGVPAANLTPAGSIGAWTEADFVKAMRTGVRPDGRTLSDQMPWKAVALSTDDELRALWLYLRSIPPVEPRKKG